MGYGTWSVVRELGHGSYGRVYEIEQTDELGINTRAALKIVEIPQQSSMVDELRSTGLDDNSIRGQFHAVAERAAEEIALLSSLQGNSNIVSYQAHEVRKHANGFGWDIYLQMELLTPLTRYQAEHSMTPRDVIRLGIDLCQALRLCQRHNILHRDIKPDNIFVSPAGDFKLGDFGVATIQQTYDSSRSRRGTIAYMAPEVYLGRPYDLRSDVYSLGIVLYQLLNGNLLPFMSSPLDDREAANHCRMFDERPLPPPAQGSPRLKNLVLRACAHDPEQRCQSAEELLQELQTLMWEETAGESGRLREQPAIPVEQRTQPRQGTGRPAVGVIVAVVVLLCVAVAAVGIAVGSLMKKPSPDPREEGIRFTYSSDTGTLTLSGTGLMADYASVDETPWAEKRGEIRTVVVEPGITALGTHAFAECGQLSTVELPEGVTVLGEETFALCTSLTSIRLPSSLERMGNGCFSGCQSLESITLPTALRDIGAGAFSNCTGLQSYSVDAGNETFTAENGVLLSADGTHLLSYPYGRTDERYDAPESVEVVEGYAFEVCPALRELSFGGSLNTVEDYAIDSCQSLERIRFSGEQPPVFGEQALCGSSVLEISYPALGQNTPWNPVVGRSYGGSVGKYKAE